MGEDPGRVLGDGERWFGEGCQVGWLGRVLPLVGIARGPRRVAWR